MSGRPEARAGRRSPPWAQHRVLAALLAAGLAGASPSRAVASGPWVEGWRRGPLAPGPEHGVALASYGRRLVYGSSTEDEPGAAAIVDGATGETLVAIASPAPGPSDGFGAAVAIDAAFVAVAATGSGTVSVFDWSGRLLRSFADPAPDPVAGSGFGAALALGRGLLVVGAPLALGGRGLVRAWDVRSGALVLAFAGDEPAGDFGRALLCAGDLLLVGAPGRDPLVAPAGRVEARGLRDGALRWRTSAAGARPGDRFGAALALRGGTVLVGAPAPGEVTTLRLRDGVALRRLAGPAGEDFGAGVAGSAGVVFVGAPGADPTETDAGLVRAFSPSGALRQAIAPAAGTYCAGAGSRLAAGPGFLAVGIVDCFGEAAVFGFSR